MADINVSLGLDDSKYKQGLANAQAGAQRLGTQLNNSFSGGLGAVTKFATGVDALNVKFANLGRVVVGLGLASFVGQALRSADALSDLSAALGTNTGRLLEMKVAASSAGGNLESLAGMLGRMEDNMQGAIDGNEKMRTSLAAVGIGFEEISQLTPEQQFNRISKALSGLTDQNKRAALATEIFGKSGRLFDFAGYTDGIAKLTGTMDDQGRAVDAAGKMMDKFAEQMSLVGAEFLKLAGPVVEFITPLDESSSAMERASVGAIALGGALAIFAASSLIRGIVTIYEGFRALAAITGISTGATALNTVATNANSASAIANATAQSFMAGAHARVGAATTAVAVAQANLSAAQASGTVTEARLLTLETALTAARGRLAVATEAAAVTQGVLSGAQTAGSVASTAANASSLTYLGTLGRFAGVAAIAAGAMSMLYSSGLNEGEDEWLAKEREKQNLLARRKAALSTLTVEQQKNYNALSQAEKNATIDSIVSRAEMEKKSALQDKIYGSTNRTGGGYAPSEEAIRKNQAITDAYNKQVLAIQDLQGAIQEKNQSQLDDLRNATESLTLSEREKSIKKETLEYESRARADLANLRQREKELTNQIATGDKDARDQARAQLPEVQKAITAITAEYEKQLPVIQAAAAAAYDKAQAEISSENLNKFAISESVKAQQQLQAIQDEMAKMTMPEIEQKYYDIGAAAKASAQEAINAENERRRVIGQSAMSLQEENKYREAALTKTNEILAATKKSYDMSRSFSTGWKKALNDYVANATNAAQRAQAIFSKATQGMEDMIVGFAKTGKFEWKSFVADMLEQLLRSQIQQVFASMMGGMQTSMSGVTGGGSGGGLGSILGSLGSLFGGGSSSYMPGESGGMPTGSSGGGFGDILGSIGGGISSAISGIGDFFGGFFANGGNLGAGKWGIAGENGPELISGPATVSPMGGGSTNVTYHINAVDAMSFKQLVAQDPGFIHAVVMQGAKSTPGTWR